jgi:SAM-dependent methyltransferase
LGVLALPLTQYLDDSGRYDGFDIAAGRVRKCRDKITPFYPNFRFQSADIYNTSYNPTGTFKASEYKFPYQDGLVDVVLARSVFTHMLPAEVDNYMFEIARTLKPGGRFLATFFLFNAATPPNVLRKFPYDFRTHRTRRQDVPEAAVSYEERFIRAMYEKHGLRIVEPIRFGSASGSETPLSRQDIIIAEKP